MPSKAAFKHARSNASSSSDCRQRRPSLPPCVAHDRSAVGRSGSQCDHCARPSHSIEKRKCYYQLRPQRSTWKRNIAILKRTTTKSKGAGRVASPRASKSAKHAAILATLDSIKQIDPECPKATGVIELLKSWLEDDSGYDEKTWPKLRKALDKERTRAGARRLFDE